MSSESFSIFITILENVTCNSIYLIGIVVINSLRYQYEQFSVCLICLKVVNPFNLLRGREGCFFSLINLQCNSTGWESGIHFQFGSSEKMKLEWRFFACKYFVRFHAISSESCELDNFRFQLKRFC